MCRQHACAYHGAFASPQVRVEERSKADKKEKSRSTMRANAVELPAEQLEALWMAVSTLGYL